MFLKNSSFFQSINPLDLILTHSLSKYFNKKGPLKLNNPKNNEQKSSFHKNFQTNQKSQKDRYYFIGQLSNQLLSIDRRWKVTLSIISKQIDGCNILKKIILYYTKKPQRLLQFNLPKDFKQAENSQIVEAEKIANLLGLNHFEIESQTFKKFRTIKNPKEQK